MNISKIQYIYDKKNNPLALVIRRNYFPKTVNFITRETDNLQIATMKDRSNQSSKPHSHRSISRKIKGTTEVLIVVKGRIEVQIFDFESNFVESVFLKKMDMVYLISGGHSVQFRRNSRIYEIKQGPYLGKKDKYFL